MLVDWDNNTTLHPYIAPLQKMMNHKHDQDTSIGALSIWAHEIWWKLSHTQALLQKLHPNMEDPAADHYVDRLTVLKDAQRCLAYSEFGNNTVPDLIRGVGESLLSDSAISMNRATRRAFRETKAGEYPEGFFTPEYWETMATTVEALNTQLGEAVQAAVDSRLNSQHHLKSHHTVADASL